MLRNFFSDIIGNIQCDALSSQTVPTKSGTREYFLPSEFRDADRPIPSL